MTESATGKVYEFICDELRKGVWKPGDRIWTEARLGQHLGVSRVAVRQATGELVAQGRLERVQGSGTFVTKALPVTMIAAPGRTFSTADLLDINIFRIGFETENVRLFIRNAGDEDVAKLEESYRRMLAAKDGDDQDTFCEQDYLFHETIANGTGNRFIIQISQLMRDMLADQQRDLNQMVGYDIGVQYHEIILRYIKEKDEELAMIFMRRHLQRVERELREKLAAENGGD